MESNLGLRFSYARFSHSLRPPPPTPSPMNLAQDFQEEEEEKQEVPFSNKSANGYKYIFVAIDNFSRYLFTRPIKTKLQI